jgi:hypothetical protein
LYTTDHVDRTLPHCGDIAFTSLVGYGRRGIMVRATQPTVDGE